MWLDKMLRFKGLTFATMGLVIIFLLYLGVNLGLQQKAQQDLRYATALMQLTDRISSNLSLPETAVVLKELETFRTGRSVRIAGKTLSTDPLAAILSPEPSQLEVIVRNIRSADLGLAGESAKKLSASVDRHTQRKLKYIDYLQIAVAIIAIVVYLFVILPMIARLSSMANIENKVVDQKNRTLSPVSEGLFILDHDYNIGLAQSDSLKRMFKTERVLDGNFFDFVGQYVSQQTVERAREFLDLLSASEEKEMHITDLSPLRAVKVNSVHLDGRYESRYLDFKFKPVMEGGALKQLLVSVTDETKRVLLEKELSDTKEEQQAQDDLVQKILLADRTRLSSFFSITDDGLKNINTTLEAAGHDDQEIRVKVKEISRITHELKNDAAALEFTKFELNLHELEEVLVAIRLTSDALTGKSLLPVITKLKDLFSELDHIQNFVRKLNLDQDVSLDPPKQTGLAEVLQDLANRVCERSSKRASLSTFGLTLDSLPDVLQDPIQSIAVQLVRNSIVHGAMLPDERLGAGKTDYVNITTSLNETDSAFTLFVRDDGEGFDNQAILDRAVDLGIIKPEDLDVIDREQAFKLIFQPGFSSLLESDLDAGRGVGLDLVHHTVKDLGGAIGVHHRRGRYCQFKVTIPKP